MDDMIGKELGPYRIIEQIGRGGMATVYKAYEPALDRYVAIKVLSQYFAHDPDFAARFNREAKAVAKLDHPNILPIYSYGQEAGLSYIVMRYVETGTLKDMLGQPLDFKTVADILGQIGRALDYAHQRGIVHRDVKPTNVLMAEGKWALLTDFGLARMVESSVRLTKTGVGVGTPPYMSPEQGQGIRVDARSDVYSLGVVLYEMVTGKVPYEAETPMAVVLKHIIEPLPLPRQVAPGVPEGMERVILKAMAKKLEDRFQTVGEMVEALEAAMRGVPVEVLVSEPPAAEVAIEEELPPTIITAELPPSSVKTSPGSRLKGLFTLLYSSLQHRPPLGKATLPNEQNLLRTELAKHKRNLYKLRDQRATFARGEEPLSLLNQIEAEENEIRRIEEELKKLGG